MALFYYKEKKNKGISFQVLFGAVTADRIWCGAPYQKKVKSIYI